MLRVSGLGLSIEEDRPPPVTGLRQGTKTLKRIAPGRLAGWMEIVKRAGGSKQPVPGPLPGQFEDVSREACDRGERVGGLGIEPRVF